MKEIIDSFSIQKQVKLKIKIMLTNQEMLKIAEQFTRKIVDKNFAPNIVLEEAIEKPYGNIYRYQSKEFLLTKDIYKAVTPATPFLVEKKTGRVVNFASAMSLENNIKAYENGTMSRASDTYWYPDEDRFSSK